MPLHLSYDETVNKASLVPKRVTDKNGKQTTVYVNPDAGRVDAENVRVPVVSKAKADEPMYAEEIAYLHERLTENRDVSDIEAMTHNNGDVYGYRFLQKDFDGEQHRIQTQAVAREASEYGKARVSYFSKALIRVDSFATDHPVTIETNTQTVDEQLRSIDEYLFSDSLKENADTEAAIQVNSRRLDDVATTIGTSIPLVRYGDDKILGGLFSVRHRELYEDEDEYGHLFVQDSFGARYQVVPVVSAYVDDATRWTSADGKEYTDMPYVIRGAPASDLSKEDFEMIDQGRALIAKHTSNDSWSRKPTRKELLDAAYRVSEIMRE